MVQIDSLIISHYILIHVNMSLWNNIYYEPEWIMKLFVGLTYIEIACWCCIAQFIAMMPANIIIYGQFIFLIMLIGPFEEILAKDLYLYIFIFK